jgi:leader peptidase (prepilin peptidase)/N-methyltransferase
VVTLPRVPAIAYDSTFNLLSFFAFALGAIVGSFLNVVIHRYPIEESIVFPPSRCPACRARIRWFDNVPIVAWLWLRGRCRDCRAPISLRYPLVEIANALFYLAIFLHTGPTIGFVLIAAFVSMIILLIYIDAEIQILPDVIDLPGVGVGIAIGALALGDADPALVVSASIVNALAGALLGAMVDRSWDYYFYFMVPFGLIGGTLMFTIRKRVSLKGGH